MTTVSSGLCAFCCTLCLSLVEVRAQEEYDVTHALSFNKMPNQSTLSACSEGRYARNASRCFLPSSAEQNSVRISDAPRSLADVIRHMALARRETLPTGPEQRSYFASDGSPCGCPTFESSSSSGSSATSGSDDDDIIECCMMAFCCRPPTYMGPTASLCRSHVEAQSITVQGADGKSAALSIPQLDARVWSLGWNYEYLLGKDIKSSRSSILMSLRYENTSISGTSEQAMNALSAANMRFESALAKVTHNMSFDILKADFNYRLNVGNTPLGCVIGFSPGVILHSSTRDVAVVDSAHVWTSNTEATQSSSNNGAHSLAIRESLGGDKGWTMSLTLGLQYEIILRKLTIIPFIAYQPELVSYTSSVEQSAHIGGGFRVIFPFWLHGR